MIYYSIFRPRFKSLSDIAADFSCGRAARVLLPRSFPRVGVEKYGIALYIKRKTPFGVEARTGGVLSWVFR